MIVNPNQWERSGEGPRSEEVLYSLFSTETASFARPAAADCS